MIKFLILITFPLLAAGWGCQGGKEELQGSSESGTEESLSTSPEGEGDSLDLSVLPPSVDPDQDNVADVKFKEGMPLDNCLGVFNPHQADSDGDGIGDACEK